MPQNLAAAFRATCVAFLMTAMAVLAEEPSLASLMGANRQQVLARLGEPKSNLVAGNREVLLFERERIVLRNNIVVEADLLPAEPVRLPPPPEPAEAVAPAATGATDAPAAGTSAPPDEAPAEPAPSRPAARPPVRPAAPAGNAPLEIRAVRKAGAPRPVSATPPPDSVAPSSDRPAEPVSQPATPSPAPSTATPPVAIPAQPAVTPAAAPPSVAPLGTSTPATPETAPSPDRGVAETTPSPPPVSTEPLARRPVVEPEVEAITTQTYVIAFIVIAGGAGYLIWRSRQRQLELAATAVSRAPFAATPAAATGARFGADLLGKLEWKRFEELVAAYYSKTGVVAVRTKSGPASPVHIKISWKGEPRPFAYVQCIAHPPGLVDAKPLHELVSALAADDIRRGYVVTTGKFNVPARDLAEEKHITLLPGDIFLEKINALPDAARNELMQETTTGDYKTPSCPQCEAKMVPVPDDPAQWRCPTHQDVKLPRRV